MEVKYEAKFLKDLKKMTDHDLFKQLKLIIMECQEANHPGMIKKLKKLKGYETFYRIRVGDYRIGIEIVENQVILVRVLHRKDVYRYFP